MPGLSVLHVGTQAVCFGEAGNWPEHPNRLRKVYHSTSLAAGLRHQASHCSLPQGECAILHQQTTPHHNTVRRDIERTQQQARLLWVHIGYAMLSVSCHTLLLLYAGTALSFTQACLACMKVSEQRARMEA